MNKSEREHLAQLVLDCDTYRLSEKESLEYITVRFGKSISVRQYYRIKRKVLSDESIQKWFEFFTRTGFVIELKKRMEEIELVQKTCMRLLKSELDKPELQQNRNWLLKLIREIRANNELLSEKDLDNPIIEQVKKRIDDSKKGFIQNSKIDYCRDTAFS